MAMSFPPPALRIPKSRGKIRSFHISPPSVPNPGTRQNIVMAEICARIPARARSSPNVVTRTIHRSQRFILCLPPSIVRTRQRLRRWLHNHWLDEQTRERPSKPPLSPVRIIPNFLPMVVHSLHRAVYAAANETESG